MSMFLSVVKFRKEGGKLQSGYETLGGPFTLSVFTLGLVINDGEDLEVFEEGEECGYVYYPLEKLDKLLSKLYRLQDEYDIANLDYKAATQQVIGFINLNKKFIDDEDNCHLILH